MSTVNFKLAAENFRKAGIPLKYLIPVAPVDAIISKSAVLSDKVLGKAPGRYNPRSDTWSGLGGNHVVKGISKADYDEMKTWPTGNIGVIGRAFPGIDSDAETVKAKKLVELALDDAFSGGVYAERLRGKGPRRLYSFKCVDPNNKACFVRTRHITYKYDNATHKLDIIGFGGQYLINGDHQSGDTYGWATDFSLQDAGVVSEMLEIDDEDIKRFIEAFEKRLEKAGGEIIRASGGGASGDEYDTADLTPVMSVDAVLDGLEAIPNNETNFPHRDDFVSVLSAIRAALGKAANDAEVATRICEWATEDNTWCDEDYFDKIWNSTERVRVGRDSLDRLFRRNGVKAHVKHVFDDKDQSAGIKAAKKREMSAKEELLSRVADKYIFGNTNNRESANKDTMREVWNVDTELLTLNWWKEELKESDKKLLAELHRQDGYTKNLPGLANFLRDMHRYFPDNFYSGEILHPSIPRGEIYREPQPDGQTFRNLVNMRYVSQTITEAGKPDKNPQRSKADVKVITTFAKQMFGADYDYEMDILAYMAQTGKRPGSLLYMVGDGKVGKSLWATLQSMMFDGENGPPAIDGAKLMNESASRFIWQDAEGCRIISIQELPKNNGGARKQQMEDIRSKFKQVVDPAAGGNRIIIEAKNKPIRAVPNYARLVITTNHNTFAMEEHERRTFFVKCGITLANRPPEEFYATLGAIIENPQRLAAFYRWLLQRDASDYNPFADPPLSAAKLENTLLDIELPAKRHCLSALYLMKASNRKAFTTTELAELMTRVGENEYNNSAKGEFDSKPNYTGAQNSEFAVAVRLYIPETMAVKFPKSYRTSAKRAPAVYFMKDYEFIMTEMLAKGRDAMFDFLDEEEDRELVPHPVELYRDPE